ncbi:MAG: hypothetical protein ACKORE_06090 [Bacteroidota bacterium]
MRQLRILTLIGVIACTLPHSASSQDASTAKPPTQLEKSRRFLIRYITFFDTIPDTEARLNIVKGVAMVANADANDWVAQYQASYHHLMIAESCADTINRNYQLERSRFYLEAAEKANADAAELTALKALSIQVTGKLLNRPSDSLIAANLKAIEQLHKKGKRCSRSELMLAEDLLNLPEGKGRDEKRAKEVLLIALPLFDQESHEDPAWPAWGKKRCEALLASMKK